MKEYLIYSVLIILWVVYSIFEGKREAYYYHALNLSSANHINLHWMYAIQRAIVMVVIGITSMSVLLPVSLAFIFPFIHDGFYYMKRNDLMNWIYKKRFKAESDTSTAVLEFSWEIRCFLFVFGLAILITSFFVLWLAQGVN